MSWLKIEQNDIDAEALEREIESEMKRRLAAPGMAAPLKVDAIPRTPDDLTALLEIAEAYAAGWDTETLVRRRPILKPLLPLAGKLIRGLLKPQYIFNSLILEILKKQEERIQTLEKEKNRE
ncbi:MAG: hypothetical protein V1789_10280 [PVC group bacterium]